MQIFFSGWESLARVVVTVPCVYVAVVLFIRLSGKRTTSQMNNFDWIVTVAMGSLVASTIVAKSTPVVEGLAAIALLLLLQYLVTKLAQFVPVVASAVRSTPALLYFDGEYQRDTMRRERIGEGEVLAAIREEGLSSFVRVKAVVLENDAKLSVVLAEGDEDLTALKDVPRSGQVDRIEA